MFLAQGQLSEFVIQKKTLDRRGKLCLIHYQKRNKKIQSQLLQLMGTSLMKLAEVAAKGPLEMVRRVCMPQLGERKFSEVEF